MGDDSHPASGATTPSAAQSQLANKPLSRPKIALPSDDSCGAENASFRTRRHFKTRGERSMITIEPDGAVRFRVYLPDAGRVEVVGDFTGWQARPVSLVRETDGWWQRVVAVPPGDHSFQYLVNGEIWLPDFAAHGVEASGFGSWNSLLRLEGAPVGLCEGKPEPGFVIGLNTPFDELCAGLCWQAAQSA